MFIKRVKGFKIKDSRGEDTIEVEIKARGLGTFYASAPNGKSKGIYEAVSYKKSIDGDIKELMGFVGEIKFEKFEDLQKVEGIFKNRVGANTMIALEYCFLKALAYKDRKEVWQVINPGAKKMPMPVGNAIGGGLHSGAGKKPDFQEFLFIPQTGKFKDAVKINRAAQAYCKKLLWKIDREFRGIRNDENAWITSLDNDSVMSIMLQVKDYIKKKYNAMLRTGIDAAGSEFFRGKSYYYANLKEVRNSKEQIEYISKISKQFFYIEDPIEQNNFKDFSKLRKKAEGLIVGDDLTVTNLSRVEKAIKSKSINAVIIKPNQVGSLIEVEKIVRLCKKNNIQIVFSHRSGETDEDILADLTFGFQSDFIKTGIWGWGRKHKLKRLIWIERRLNK